MSSLLKRKHVLAALSGGVSSQTYQQQIVADGAIAYWPLDDPSGTTARDLVGTRHGTITGGVTLNQPGVNGSKCMVFNEVDSWIALPSVPSFQPAFTWEGWCKPQSISPASTHFMGRLWSGANGFSWDLNAGSPRIRLSGGANLLSAAVLQISTWWHVVVIGNGTSASIYINGVLNITGPLALPADPGTGQAAIGMLPLPAPNGIFNGYLQDVAIYPRALTPAEIQSHYTKRLAGAPFSGLVSTQNMVSYWSLKNLQDSHGTNHLTNNGGVTFLSDAADFEASSSQYLSHADPTPLGDEDFTYSCWFKPESAGEYTILVKGPGRSYWLEFRADVNAVRFMANFGSQLAPVPTTFVVGQWYFAVFGYNSATDKIFLYVNNGAVSEATASLTSAGGNVTIGALNAGEGAFFDGLIKMVGLWRRVLTAGERTALFNSGNGLPY